MEIKLNINKKRYLVLVDTDDQQQLKKFVKHLKKQTRWWKFWNTYIVLPKGIIEFYQL